MAPMLSTKQLEQHRGQLIAYLRMKLEEEDWHGVLDAAADLREIEAQLAVHKGGHHG